MKNIEHYVIQKKSNPKIYYRLSRGNYQRGKGYRQHFVEVNHIDKATKFATLSKVKIGLGKYFSCQLKSQLVDMTDGVNIIHCSTQIVEKEVKVDKSTNDLISEIQNVAKMVNETHYSVMELIDKIRNQGLRQYKFIMSTSYDRLKTSKILELFEEQGLEPIKHKGNFAFDKEEYLTAAQLLCDVPFKTYKLT